MEKKKKKPTPRQPNSFQHFQVLFLLLSAPSYFQLFMEQAVCESHGGAGMIQEFVE